ncbi:EpsG family protein [Pelotalea chapellei]|uniref:EpsG family protein n=1 Tax=Pelotalea chapellei TaxID=44671 RepID=A0ABS5U5L8_9BACT|nr:EpsG family protein [Pelotalea chapellei]MBT1070966.1 EpsG family protein [Pelotalea chapellei]
MSSTIDIKVNGHCTPNTSVRYRTFLIFLLFALVGLFYIESGVDFENYVNYFDVVRTYDYNDLLINRIEPFFGLLTFILVRFFISNFWVYFFLLIISIFLKSYILSRIEQSWFSFSLIICFYLFRYFPLYELTQIRVSIAIGFVMIAFLLSGMRLRCIFFLVACLTHYSILVLLPLLLILYISERFSSEYQSNENLIWMLTIICFSVAGLGAHSVLQYLTPYFSVLQIYDTKSFGEVSVSPFSATILIDIVGIISALAIQQYMTPSTRFWIYAQVLGIICFYSFIDFPIVAYRVKELFSIFWIFYIFKAVQHEGLVRLHAFLFTIICSVSYLYFYFIGASAIF